MKSRLARRSFNRCVLGEAHEEHIPLVGVDVILARYQERLLAMHPHDLQLTGRDKRCIVGSLTIGPGRLEAAERMGSLHDSLELNRAL